MLFRHAQRAPHDHLNRLPVRGICDDRPLSCILGGDASSPAADSSSSSPPPASHSSTSSPFDPVASRPPASTTTVVHTTTESHSASSAGSASDSGSSPSVSTPTPTLDPISTPVDTPPPTTFTPATGVYSSPSPASSGLPDLTDTTSSNSTTTDLPTPKPPNHSTITYIGIAAGAILVLALLFAAISFVMKRINKRRENEALGDVFDRNSFVNDSAPIPDGPEENSLPSERGRPRPPTMIDRHIRTANRTPGPDFGNYGATGAAVNNGGYYGQDQYGGQYGQYDDYNNAGYGQGYNQYGQYAAGAGYTSGAGYASGHDGFAPPQAQMAQYDSPSQSPIGDVFTDHIASNPQYINAQVSGPEYPALPAAAVATSADHSRSLTRQPSGKAEVAYPNVTDLGRGTSVTPFQAAQYAAIGKRLHNEDGAAAVGGNPSQAYAKLDRQPQHAANGRPPSAYDSDDAYGGI